MENKTERAYENEQTNATRPYASYYDEHSVKGIETLLAPARAVRYIAKKASEFYHSRQRKTA